MKLSNLVYAAVGYTLGARAGRERYESIVRLTRRVTGSQTVQSTAGVVQAKLDQQLRGTRSVSRADRTSAGHRGAVNGHS
ncbi:MAG: hypothetical protein ABI345_03055 [Jatrophihabitans sp.]